PTSAADPKLKALGTSVAYGIPSTTIKGSALPLNVDVPRIRICIPDPGSPELAAMSTPGKRPCKASSIELDCIPCNTLALIVAVAVVKSRAEIFNKPVFEIGRAHV